MNILEIRDLKKTYEAEIPVQALRGINLTIEKGEMLAIMGPSGSGKSTLLNLLSGIEEKTSGDIIVEGSSIDGLKEDDLALYRRRKIGIIYQFFNLIPSLSVRNNIKLPVLLDNKSVDEDYFLDLVKGLGLTNKLDSFPDNLSGGQQQRVAIGRSLIYRPSIILADEPTGNLDRKNSQEIIELFRLSNLKYKQTIIIVTHDEKVALAADRIIYMEDGLIVKDQVVR